MIFRTSWRLVMTLLTVTNRDDDVLGTITGLYRHAVKGLSADSLTAVSIANEGETFPDDRRFALLVKEKKGFDEASPEWLHKEKFLCAFTAPRLLAKYQTSYQMKGKAPESATGLSYAQPCDEIEVDESFTMKRFLSVRDRKSQNTLLGPVDLCLSQGREDLASFFSRESGQDVVCVSSSGENHNHQFGNTSSGVKSRGDTRTVHLVNANTVADLSRAIGKKLNPTRFRPNIVIDGPAAWSEFDWIGKKIQCGSLQLEIISRTVRCDGVGVDPLDQDTVLDIPKLLINHFPEKGPYLGVYAVISEAGTLKVGDNISLC